jgi:hypothetical protein
MGVRIARIESSSKITNKRDESNLMEAIGTGRFLARQELIFGICKRPHGAEISLVDVLSTLSNRAGSK